MSQGSDFQQQVLKEKADILFQRKGISGNPALQKKLWDLINRWEELLGEQKRIIKDDGGDEFSQALNQESLARADLHVVRETEQTKQELMALTGWIDEYRDDYLIPSIRAKNTHNVIPVLADEDVAASMLGSIIRIVIDTHGKKNCYVPDSDDPLPFIQDLSNSQLEILRLTRNTPDAGVNSGLIA